MKCTNLARIVLLGAAILFLHCATARAEKRIGILMFGEEIRYYEALNGIREELGKSGFREPGVRFVIGNAKGNKARAAELVHTFAVAHLDLIITLGTSATIATAHETRQTPIVFTMVYDPVEAKIAASWQSSGNNTTGTSSRVPMAEVVSRLNELVAVKRLAVLYTPGEKNTESPVRELQKLQESFGIKVIPVPLTKQGEAASVMPEVIRTSDAILITGSNIVESELALIIDLTTRAKRVTVAHLQDLAEKGVLMAVCSDPRQIGRLAGKKAVQVLKGARPSSIPIETVKVQDVIINMRTVKAGGFQIPSSFMRSVTKVIE